MEKYKKRVKLLVQILRYVAKEKCFALKGGTAINLFYRDFPRISVDIDLTYIHFNDREIAYKEINEALNRIKKSLDQSGFKTKMSIIPTQQQKIYCMLDSINHVKIEVNYTIRGYYLEPKQLPLTDKAQDILGEFVLMNLIAFEEVFGEKICAGLDRQHPRDLFDCRHLLEKEGINERIKKSFMVSLLSHNRPLHEILRPNFKDRTIVFKEEFEGMTDTSPEYHTYKHHKETFYKLVEEIHNSLSQKDKEFLLSFVKLEHSWKDIDIKNIHRLPAIQWKIKNLEKLRENNKEKFEEQHRRLKEALQDK